MEELLASSRPKLRPKTRNIPARRRSLRKLARTLILLPPCILIGLIGALLLSCPDRRVEKRK